MLNPERWTTKQRILVILAHPDDPEFFCGASIARWISDKHEVNYCLFTKGEKGSSDPETNVDDLTSKRVLEQEAAARVLGVNSVVFLDYQDGELIPGIEQRKKVVRVIRRFTPDIVITCDPENYYPRPGRINHPDHLAAGRIVIEAIYPAAGNPLYFPELIKKERLLPHQVKELWLSSPSEGDAFLDVSVYWEKKLRALHEHLSQIGDIEEFDKKMRSRFTKDSTAEAPRYEERFIRIIIE
jgi:LmbE family N-acetylglucosaminyl deacetylase